MAVDKSIEAKAIFDASAIAVAKEVFGGDAKLQEKTIAPTTSQQVVTPDTGYDGFSKVTVNAVTASIDEDIIADNIKKDVDILGVVGTLEPASQE